MSSGEIENLAYVDIQHDALAVFDDVDQGTVLSEDIWISGYQFGETSLHGKAKVIVKEGGGSELVPREGVKIERISKTTFNATIPSLSIQNRLIKFPKQVINPPYTKKSDLDAPLHINCASLNPKSAHIVLGGPDGYCVILPTSLNTSTSEKPVMLQGHVGDVRDVKWFPSGEVILTASSDLSIRIYGKNGINPRTLRGHTRAITCIHIIGIGKTILSGSKDGTIRLWDISKNEEIDRWLIGTSSRKAVDSMIILNVNDPTILGIQDVNVDSIMLLNVQDGIWIQPFSTSTSKGEEKEEGWFVKNQSESQLLSIAHQDGIVVSGYTNGMIEIMDLENLRKPSKATATNSDQGESQVIGRIKRIKRNESPIYSLVLTKVEDSQEEGRFNLYVGTAAGLPCVLSIMKTENGFRVETKEELAGWEAVGVEAWAIGKEGEVWCAGGEGGLRRY
ncbi:uncharacterized protein IL334_003866 [Kwoniella shivajii]|uniref:WD40 repeat-like protein n=1 Tax=Kwoniella shivajii TaxID=564305 RepID=A0ABZ1CZ57_9TREE|nr:hypothetical protein IL334_003866 [Kwoniella shivajii]